MWTDVHRRLALKWMQLRGRRDALTRKRDQLLASPTWCTSTGPVRTPARAASSAGSAGSRSGRASCTTLPASIQTPALNGGISSMRPDLPSRHANLRSWRVSLRQQIETLTKQLQLGVAGDPWDGRQRLAALQQTLAGTDRDWEHLCLPLGKDPYPQPVRLNPAPRATRAAPRNSGSIKAAAPGYLTRALTSR
jgi:hypothetical protein